MELLPAIQKRASIRKYKEGKLSDEQIRLLMEAAMKAPSGMNIRPYRFVVVRDEEMLKKVKTASKYAGYNAPNAIVVIGNTKASPFMWGNDGGAATENILLQAAHMGLGTVWCGLYPIPGNGEAMKKILSLKEEEEAYSLILIGIPAEEKNSRGTYEEDKVTII